MENWSGDWWLTLADDCVALFFGVVTFITFQDVPKQATIVQYLDHH